MTKRILCLLLALAALCVLGIPVLAAPGDSGFSDVPPGAWYAQAADYVRENGLMSGTTATAFSPDTPASRATLATILYRRAGSPAAHTADFPDVTASAWYGDAAGWAAAEGIISGYGDGRFGPDDPVTREQLATILWRAAGSPAPVGASAFADQRDISPFAVSAVAWAWESGIVGGKGGNRFDPRGTTTRAELAVMLHRWLGNETPAPSETPGTGPTTLVAYFSCTGSTQAIAETLAEHLNADLYVITPAQPYTTADLNYSDSTSRSNREQNDSAARPVLGGSTLDLKGYDRIYLGYPLWFGQAPKIISTFLEGYDFSGKIIIPFCTSGSSGMGSSADNLHRLAPDATWLSERRFDRNVSDATITSWADRLFQQAGSGSSSGGGGGSIPAPDPTPTPTPTVTPTPTPTPTFTPDQEEEPSMPMDDASLVGYTEYRAAKDKMREVLTVKANIDALLGDTRLEKNKEQER